MRDMAGTEMDQDFLTKFSCLGTSDKESLVNDLHQLLGSQISREGCAFFLDMTNWNLQAAVGAFYDFYSNQSSSVLPLLTLLSDVTVGNGEPVAPNTRFSKTWRVKNSGMESWPEGSYLSHRSGFTFGSAISIPLPLLRPGEAVEVTVELLSPTLPGLFQSQWRMCTPTGIPCGDSIWVVVSVEEGGVLGLTQQLSGISTTDTSSSAAAAAAAATSMDTLDHQQQQQQQPHRTQPAECPVSSSELRNPFGTHSVPSTCDPDSSTSDMALGPEQSGVELHQATMMSSSTMQGEAPTQEGGSVATDDSGLWDQSTTSFS